MHIVTALMLICVGVIHLIPITGVLGGEKLAALYGVAFDDSNARILMRHRAILFGLLGALLVVAAFVPPLQVTAWTAGCISVVSFLVLARLEAPYNAQIRRVVIADIVALVCLAVAALTWSLEHTGV